MALHSIKNKNFDKSSSLAGAMPYSLSSKKKGINMHTLTDEDGNVYNVELKIVDNSLQAVNEVDREAEPIIVDLKHEMIDITLRA